MPTGPIDVVLITIGSAGDLFPFLRIGTVLRDLGHRVSFVAPWLHQPYVEQAGVAFHGLDIDEAVLDDPDLWHAIRGFGVVWRATRPAMAQVQALVTPLLGERSLLIAHPLALPEVDLIRAAHPGVTVVAGILAPQNLPTIHDPLMVGPRRMPAWVPHSARRLMWRGVEKYVLSPVALPGINAARKGAGLAPVAGLLQHLASAPDLTLLLFPGWFGPPQPDWPQPLLQGDFALYDPHPQATALSPALQAFLAAGPAPLVFTHGTGNRQASAYFAAARDATVQLGRRAIFLTPHAQQVPANIPPAILWQDYVPLRALLPHAAALMHHGGIGTTAEALRAGTPQLIIPLAHDQFDNAERVKALGVGARLDATRVSAARLASALQALLDTPGLETRCRQVAARFDHGAAFAAACAALLQPAREI
jgi:rhamnosyltransferase subunit B